MSDHEATPKANQVKDTGEKAYSEADQGRGSGRTNPMMNRASAEALPKIFSPLAAATSPMKTRGIHPQGIAGVGGSSCRMLSHWT